MIYSTVKPDLTFFGWQKSLLRHGFTNLAKDLDSDPVYDFNLLAELKLPIFKSIQVPVVDFLKNFSEYSDLFKDNNYALLLIPLCMKFQKHSLLNFSELEVAREFINSKIDGNYENYLLRLSEYKNNVFGGSIISHNGLVYVEMVDGVQKYLSYGKRTPIYGKLTPTTISTKYSTKNPNLRELLWRSLSAIEDKDISKVNSHELRGRFYLSGYFEFAYIKGPYDNLKLVFFDVKTNPILQNFPSIH